MIIRKATAKDLDNGLFEAFRQGYRFHEKARPDFFQNFSDEELLNILVKNLNDEEKTTLVVEENNYIVAYAVYRFKVRATTAIYVDEIIVNENYRGKKYGEQLMEYIEQIGKDHNCSRVDLDCWTFNTRGLHFYEKNGYTSQRTLFEKNL